MGKKQNKKAPNQKKLLAIILIAALVLACAGVATYFMLGKDAQTGASGAIVPTDYVEIEIENYGVITAELYGELAPITVKNFLKLADEGFYDGLTFHRIISGFMIQGGDPLGNGMGGSAETIKGEFSSNGVPNDLAHTRGVLSMARSQMPDSASSQFFIMHQDSPHLNGQYAAFGRVTSGIEIVDEICANTPVQDGNGTVLAADQPKIVRIDRIEKPAE